MAKGGRYIREKPGAKAERVAWTKPVIRPERKTARPKQSDAGAKKPAAKKES